MDPAEEQEVDPRMAEMMGFSTFGMQPGAKKRKTSHDATRNAASQSTSSGYGSQNGAHHPNPLTYQFATGSNAAPVGSKPAFPPPKETKAPQEERSSNSFPTGVPMEIFDKLTWTELEAYRKGVKDEKGDLAWFLPSFIEDPWAKLEKMRETSS